MTERSIARIDSASRVIRATPMAIYQAWLDPDALVAWLPPAGMRGEIHVFEPYEGGRFRMSLIYNATEASGKTDADTDVVECRFVELRPGERIVQTINFDSDDPAFAGTMTMTWKLTSVRGGAEVTISATNVPPGIRPEDHAAGMSSTLENLATFLDAHPT